MLLPRRPVLIASVLAAACLGLAACSPAPQTVRIGLAQPLSGELGGDGRSMVNAARLAADELNQRPLKAEGRSLHFEIVEADDKDSDAGAQAAARALVAQDVAAVIGHLTSGASIAAAPVYAKAQVPQLSTATQPQYTRLGHATTLRLVAHDDVQAQALASFCRENFGTLTVGVVDDGSVYGKGLADAAAREFAQRQLSVALRMTVDGGTREFAPLMRQVRDRGVQLLLITLELPQATALMEQLLRARLDHMVVVGGDTLKMGAVPPAAAALAGLYARTPFVDMNELQAGRAFAQRYRAAFGRDPVDGSHYAYDAVHVIASTMQTAGAVRGDRLLAALKRADPQAPITGYLRFDARGEQRFASVGIYAARGGQWRLLARSDAW